LGVNFWRAVAVLACCCLSFTPAAAQVAASDPAFTRVPFDRWVEEGGSGPFHWSARVSSGTLSNHQRLRARVEVTIDGGDLANRRGHGYLTMMVQIQDADHRVYQSHRSLNLERISEEAAKSNIVYTQDVFVRPGEYRVGIAVFDSETGEHGAALKPLRVNPLKNDSLPDAWLDLPAVEFVPAMEMPESLYLPNSGARLRLPVESRRPVHIELMVNASPTRSQEGLHSGPANNRYLLELLPALKVMSQLQVRNGELHVSLVDLTRRQVLFEQALFEQDRRRDLRWMRLRRGLGEADPNKIDVRALEHREQNAQFFVAQIRERVLAPAAPESGKPLRIGIVISGPMGFESGEDLHPITLDNKAEYRIYYFRHHMLPPPQLPMLRARRNLPPLPPRIQEPLDVLVNLIKPLRPRVFDVYNPEQFRKALGAMLEEISHL
jgi:hypothetical protein